MNELVRFGPDGRLVGVLSGGKLASPAPILVLPNAGLVPRAGPFRLHVELAERLAAHGIRTFRFDTPGVGESARLAGCGEQKATIAALDHLAAHHGGERFVVGGVCSAADLGWNVAVRDPRVSGMLVLDGISYPDFWFHAARIGNVVKRGPRAWLGIAARLLGRTAAAGTAGAGLDVTDYRDWPDRTAAKSRFAELVARGTGSLWIYTGGYSDLFLDPRQFYRTFGPAAHDSRVTLHYWPDCDHTYYARGHRDRLLDTIENWMLAQYPATGEAAA